jgi:hypothetical protein
MFRVRHSIISLTLLFAGISGIMPRAARAANYYFEFGATTVQMTNPAPLFQSLDLLPATSAESVIGIPFTLGVHLQNSQRGLLFALALQSRYMTGSTSRGTGFTAFPISPMIRMEFWRLVLGFGYTPYVFKDLTFQKNGGIDSVMTMEAQFLFPISPEIDFGLQSARTAFKSRINGDGPIAMEYGAFFRLNFGLSDAASSERQKFKGWRYPLGSPMR